MNRDKDKNKRQLLEAAKLGCLALKAKAEARYHANPPFCKFCNKQIPLMENKRVCETMKKKFCDQTCAAYYNNEHFPKTSKRKIKLNCVVCGAELFTRRKYCDGCLKENNRKNGQKSRPREVFNYTTKGKLIERSGTIVYSNYIRKHAREVFQLSGRDRVCIHCGYDKHVNICHIKPLKDFSIESTMGEMNDLDNIIALCPNCHWEFDHGMLMLPNNYIKKSIDFKEIDIEAKLKKQVKQSVHPCPICSMPASTNYKHCSTQCAAKSLERINWPAHNELKDMVDKQGYEATGRELELTGAAVKKRLKRHPE